MVPTHESVKKYEKLNNTYMGMGNGIFLNTVMVQLPSCRFKLYVTGKTKGSVSELTVLLQQQHQFHCGYTTEMFCKHLSDILNGDEIHAYELITTETSFFQFSYLKMQYTRKTFI